MTSFLRSTPLLIVAETGEPIHYTIFEQEDRYYTNMTSRCGVLVTGITPPREDCTPSGDNPLEGELLLLYTTQGCHICFIIPNNIHNTKGEKWQTPEILDKYTFVWKITNYSDRDVQLLHWRIRVQQKPQNLQLNFLKTWTNESNWCFASFFRQNLYQKTFKLHLLIPLLNQSRSLFISKTLNLFCLFVLLLSLLVRATLTVVAAVV